MYSTLSNNDIVYHVTERAGRQERCWISLTLNQELLLRFRIVRGCKDAHRRHHLQEGGGECVCVSVSHVLSLCNMYWLYAGPDHDLTHLTTEGGKTASLVLKL